MIVLFCTLFLFCTLSAQQSQILAGPMLGYNTPTEVMIWLQTRNYAKIQIQYFPVNQKNAVLKSQEINTFSPLVGVSVQKYFIAKVPLQVQPETTYEYEIYLNGKKVVTKEPLLFTSQSFWHYRKDPKDFSFALGSCFFVNDSIFDRPGKPYGGNYEILGSLASKKPNFMVWLGDNTYMREPDWFSANGMIYRYFHTRSLPKLQVLLRSFHHYAIWDDHDYGPNDSDRSFVFKDWSKEIFLSFWPNPKPVNDKSYYTSFLWEDTEFFLLDNRSFRTPNKRKTQEKTILGKEQFEWLIDALVSSKATFKFVCIGGQVLNTAAKFENYAIFEEERKLLIETIQKEEIKGVVFLTGDRHHSELTKTPNSPILYDLTVSPLTAGAAKNSHENNEWRVPGTYVAERNFAILTVSGKKDQRSLKISIFDKDGKLLWEKNLTKQDF